MIPEREGKKKYLLLGVSEACQSAVPQDKQMYPSVKPPRQEESQDEQNLLHQQYLINIIKDYRNKKLISMVSNIGIFQYTSASPTQLLMYLIRC